MRILIGILNSLVIISSIFMICLILIQRGKGGGLAGAFGGMGGSSAFGTKAGDVFTRVTMVTAVIWMLMLMILVIFYNRGTESAWNDTPSARVSREVPPTPGGGRTGKAPAPRAKQEAPAAASESSSAPVSVPALPDEAPAPATPAPKSK